MQLKINNNILFLLGALLLVGVSFYFFADIVIYVILSFVLSLVGQPLMRFFLNRLRLKRFKVGSAVAALLTLILFLVGFGLFISLFVPVIIQQAVFLADVDYASLAHTLDEPIAQLTNYLNNLGIDVGNRSSEQIMKDMLSGIFNPNKVGDFFGSIFSLASGTLMGLFSVLFITFFFLQEQGMFQNFILAMVPNRYVSQVKKVMDETIRLLTRYFSGIFLQMTLITIFVSVLLGIFGIQNALLIGFFAAITNVIPYLGPIIGASFGVLVTLSANGDAQFYVDVLPKIFRVLGTFAAMQMLDNFLLQPFIFSNSVKAHPLEIFIVILLAAKIGGIGGMVLAIPVYTMLRVVARNFLSEFKFVQRLTEGIESK